jgi:hypothetical protein
VKQVWQTSDDKVFENKEEGAEHERWLNKVYGIQKFLVDEENARSAFDAWTSYDLAVFLVNNFNELSAIISKEKEEEA